MPLTMRTCRLPLFAWGFSLQLSLLPPPTLPLSPADPLRLPNLFVVLRSLLSDLFAAQICSIISVDIIMMHKLVLQSPFPHNPFVFGFLQCRSSSDSASLAVLFSRRFSNMRWPVLPMETCAICRKIFIGFII